MRAFLKFDLLPAALLGRVRHSGRAVSLPLGGLRPRSAAPRPAFTLAPIAAFPTGCGGFRASKSVSPLDFILPGLLQNWPATPVMPPETNTVPLLAQANPVAR
jgi:hypothetical protein